jgi:hypothetical protein
MAMSIDFLGPQGGALAMAFGGGCMTSGTALIAAWRLLLSPRERELKEELAAERIRCDQQIQKLNDRVAQLEGAMMVLGPASPRLAMAPAPVLRTE